ncbi:MAG: carbohydrate-binding family 9-like protein [Candidatus Omnitrophota bacterium]
MYNYICRRIKSNFSESGFLAQDQWRDIEEIYLVENNGDKLPDAFATKAQMCWDEKSLYVRFICEDPYIWATMTGQEQPLWEEEVVELFIDPEGNGRNYIELEVNPLNNVLSLLIPNPDEKGKWRENAKFRLKNLKTSVINKKNTWITDIIVPFENFADKVRTPLKNGDVWRLNLYRIERSVKEKPEEYMLIAWSPTFKNDFHIPQNFGKITFAGF